MWKPDLSDCSRCKRAKIQRGETAQQVWASKLKITQEQISKIFNYFNFIAKNLLNKIHKIIWIIPVWLKDLAAKAFFARKTSDHIYIK